MQLNYIALVTSSRGIMSVIYLCFRYESGKFEVCIVMNKSRLLMVKKQHENSTCRINHLLLMCELTSILCECFETY